MFHILLTPLMILVIGMMCRKLMQQIWSTIAKDIIAWLYLPLQKIRAQDPMVICWRQQLSAAIPVLILPRIMHWIRSRSPHPLRSTGCDAWRESSSRNPAGSSSPTPCSPAPRAGPGSSTPSGSSKPAFDATPAPTLPPVAPLPRGLGPDSKAVLLNQKSHMFGMIKYGLFNSTREPESVQEALGDSKWRSAMQDEYDALI